MKLSTKQHLKDLEKLLTETVKHRENVREDANDIRMRAGDTGEAWGELQLDVEEAHKIAQKNRIDVGGSKNGGSGTTKTKEQEQELINRIGDLGAQVWLQHAEMKARRARAESFSAACRVELKHVRYLKQHVVLLLGRVSRTEVGVEDAAKDLLEVINRLIQGIEKQYL